MLAVRVIDECIASKLNTRTDQMSPDFPSIDLMSEADLARGAVDLLRRHFLALNTGDKAAFRDTAFLFSHIDGQRFDVWWDGMRSLTPLDVEFSNPSVDRRLRTRGRRGADQDLHFVAWVDVKARSQASGHTYQDWFVVWFLVESGVWKLGCRNHWWLRTKALVVR